MTALALAAVLLAPLPARADEPAVELRGGWVAKTGAAVFRGRWTAQPSTNPATDAQGSWTLLGEGDAIALEGTWAARRDERKKAWLGVWTARGATGGLYAGTWETRLGRIPGKTFFDLMRHAKTTRVAGSWRMGRMTGDFWLEAQ